MYFMKSSNLLFSVIEFHRHNLQITIIIPLEQEAEEISHIICQRRLNLPISDAMASRSARLKEAVPYRDNM